MSGDRGPNSLREVLANIVGTPAEGRASVDAVSDLVARVDRLTSVIGRVTALLPLESDGSLSDMYHSQTLTCKEVGSALGIVTTTNEYDRCHSISRMIGRRCTRKIGHASSDHIFGSHMWVDRADV